MPAHSAALTETDADWGRFAAIIKRPAGPARGITLQDLLAMLPPPQVLGLP